MRVEIYSDIACPWCYIGKKRFVQALAAWPGGADVEVVMRPFQLDPTLSADPAASRAASVHYVERFGPDFPKMEARVAALAAAEGIRYESGAIRVTNTFQAHRLLWLAEREGGLTAQGRVADGLFDAYFTQGRVVSDPETLVAVAQAAGLDAERVRAFLASDEGREEVSRQLAEARGAGISSVPTFVFEGRWAVPGAQDVETFVSALSSVASELGAPTGAGDDGACAP
jgi:predicted DsbA family dithiol-disulfide isomerase